MRYCSCIRGSECSGAKYRARGAGAIGRSLRSNFPDFFGRLSHSAFWNICASGVAGRHSYASRTADTRVQFRVASQEVRPGSGSNAGILAPPPQKYSVLLVTDVRLPVSPMIAEQVEHHDAPGGDGALDPGSVRVF